MSAYVGILCQINYCNSKLMASFSFFPFAIPAALRMRIVNSTTSSTALNDLESYESKHMCNLIQHVFFSQRFLIQLAIDCNLIAFAHRSNATAGARGVSSASGK
jgi:hypothetical protein